MARSAGKSDPNFNASDMGFGSGGGTGSLAAVGVMLNLPDGKAIIAGSFTAFNTIPRAGLARLNADGSLDTSFNPGSGGTGVAALALRPDGKIYVGGSFTSFGGLAVNYLVRLNPDGSLDTSFNTAIGANNSIKAMALQADGKLLIGGNFTTYAGQSSPRVARVNPDGSLDTSFVIGTGIAGAYTPEVRAIGLQSDGKVVLGGLFQSYNGITRNGIVRLLTNGALDTGFVGTTVSDKIVRNILVLPDDKLYIAGTFNNYNVSTANHVARLLADGTLDTTFSVGAGAGGRPAGSSGSSSVTDIDLQSDGKLVVAGDFPLFNGVTASRLVRVNIDGSTDATFNAGYPGVGCSCAPFHIGMVFNRGNDKLVISGSFSSYNGVVKYNFAGLNANGSYDAHYNPGTGANNTINALAVQADGKTVIGGTFISYGDMANNRVARINRDGTRDTTFQLGGADGIVRAMALQMDGKVLLGGEFYTYHGTASNRIARLNTDGTVDTGFQVGTGANGHVMALALQPDGKILLGGYFTSYNGVTRNRIARLNANGTLDTSFDPGVGFNNTVLAIAVQPDGDVVVGGDFTLSGTTSRNRIARLNANGSLDTLFDPGTAADASVYAVLPQADGSVLIGGAFTLFNGLTARALVKLLPNGSIDSSFNTGTGLNGHVRALLARDDGQFLVAGAFTTYKGAAAVRLIRLNPDASIDNSFAIGSGPDNTVFAMAARTKGRVMLGGDFISINGVGRNRIACIKGDGAMCASGANGHVRATQVQADKKALVAGDFTQVGGLVRNHIARLDEDGDVDTTFNPGSGANASVHAIRHQPDGRIVAAGAFTTFAGASHGRVVRLLANGALDTSFNASAGANNTVNAVLLQADNRLVIGGAFTSVAGVSRNGIARLHSDGSLDSSFDPGTGVNGDVQSLALTAEGKILVGGTFSEYNNQLQPALVRVNIDGSLDSNFDAGDVNNAVKTIAVQDDGKVLVGGDFTTVNAVPANRVARLHDNGALDSSFDVGAGVDSSVEAAVLQDDSKIIITGDFGQVNSNGKGKIARLHANGAVDTEFDPGEGADSRISSVALQDDGKILIGGDFSTYDGEGGSNIARVLAETDGDEDGVVDRLDNCVLDANTDQQDTDLDGTGDVCDSDDDNDSVPDTTDVFPLDASETTDTDTDGTGNNADLDDDNDSVPDYIDAEPLNAANAAETVFPLNSIYKGSQLKESSSLILP
jgi:uncharacterized delta-60 repeat protein